jgi:hypothetical protein
MRAEAEKRNALIAIHRRISTLCFVVVFFFVSGQIVTVETFNTPILNGQLDCRITRWTESIVDDCPYAFAIRVFHCRHPDGHHTKHSSIIDSLKIGWYHCMAVQVEAQELVTPIE